MNVFDSSVVFGWGGVIIALTAAVIIGRSQAKSKAAEIWEGEAQAHKERADRLEGEKRDLQATLAEMADRLSRLEQLPDLSKIIAFMQDDQARQNDRYTEGMTKVHEMFEGHEDRAVQRHEKTMESMEEMIAAQAGLAAQIARSNHG